MSTSSCESYQMLKSCCGHPISDDKHLSLASFYLGGGYPCIWLQLQEAVGAGPTEKSRGGPTIDSGLQDPGVTQGSLHCWSQFQRLPYKIPTRSDGRHPSRAYPARAPLGALQTPRALIPPDHLCALGVFPERARAPPSARLSAEGQQGTGTNPCPLEASIPAGGVRTVISVNDAQFFHERRVASLWEEAEDRAMLRF